MKMRTKVYGDSLTTDVEIYHATVFGHLEIIKFLAPLTDNPNSPCKDGKTPLHVAAEKGYLKVCEAILKNIQGKMPKWKGKTPLMLAFEKNHFELWEFLAKDLK